MKSTHIDLLITIMRWKVLKMTIYPVFYCYAVHTIWSTMESTGLVSLGGTTFYTKYDLQHNIHSILFEPHSTFYNTIWFT